jgi:type I restriction enzyme S subunit
MRAIILSIKPEFSKKILAGDKKIELRKKVGQFFIEGNTIYIYESSPTKMLVATCIIEKIKTIRVGEITSKQLEEACVERTFYDTYFKGKDVANLIYLTNVNLIRRPLSLEFLKQFEFAPPQSFCYATDTLLNRVEGTI